MTSWSTQLERDEEIHREISSELYKKSPCRSEAYHLIHYATDNEY